jgi:histone-lysine N-methyltransferase SETMAR
VPHRLSDDQKAARATLARELLSLLEQQERRAWHDLIPLDESWFYFSTDREMIWLAPGETTPRERHMIQSPKIMVTVAWNTSGFHVLAALPKGIKFNARYYITDILTPIMEWRAGSGIRSPRKLIVHADNSRPHTAKSSMEFFEANGMRKAPHPAYSPDLAPSDFFLF